MTNEARPEKQSSCFKWLQANCKAGRRDPNVTSYNGGKWVVEGETQRFKFLREYHRSLEDNFTMSLVERKAAISSLASDLDLEKLGVEAVVVEGESFSMQEVAERLLLALGNICNQELGTSLEGLKDWQLATRGSNVHAITPRVKVTDSQSKALFTELQDQMYSIAPAYNWKEAIDPITKGGLRMVGSVSNKSTEVYRPVDDQWQEVELSIHALVERSLIPDRQHFLSDSRWKGFGDDQRDYAAPPGFDMPDGDWVTLAKKVAMEDLGIPCRLDSVRGNLYTFSPTSHRTCCHKAEGHDRNRFSLVFAQNGSILYRCLQDDCRTMGAKRVGSWPVPCMFADSDGHIHQPRTLLRLDEEYLSVLTEAWNDAKEDKDAAAEGAALGKAIQYINRFQGHILDGPGWIARLTFDDRENVDSYKIFKTSSYLLNFRSCHGIWAAWLSSPKRRVYQHEEYDPSGSLPDDVFNKFIRLEVERAAVGIPAVHDPAAIAEVLKLLHVVLCNGNQRQTDYVLNWLAYMLQRRNKTGVAIVMNSEEGAGKGIFWQQLVGQRIIGQDVTKVRRGNYVSTKQIEEITGKFNPLTSERLLVVGDELTKLSMEQLAVIRSITTASSENIQCKGVDTFVNSNSCSSYVFLTNLDHTINTSPADRHYNFINCSNEHLNDRAFLKPVIDSLDTAAPHFTRMLLDRDIKNWDPQNDRPITADVITMREGFMKPVARFLKHCIEVGQLEMSAAGTAYQETWPRPAQDQPALPGATVGRVSTNELHEGFQKWARQNYGETHGSWKIGLHTFSADLKKLAKICSKPFHGVRNYEWLSKDDVKANLLAAHQWVDGNDL